MKLDTTRLMKEIVDMKKTMKYFNVEQLRRKYNYLHTHTPTMFDIVYSGEECIHILKFLLERTNQIQDKKIDVEAANKIVADKFYGMYIEPVLPPVPDTEGTEEACGSSSSQ